jgi:nucleoside-diphosphate-sugar epimerase
VLKAIKALVTGATGFIGSHEIERRLSSGHEVKGLVRNADGAARLQACAAESISRGSNFATDRFRPSPPRPAIDICGSGCATTLSHTAERRMCIFGKRRRAKKAMEMRGANAGGAP